MNTIQITVTGTDLETITLNLSETEVQALYVSNRELKEKIKELEKEVKSKEQNYKWSSEKRDELQAEINHANTLLTALGVQLQTNEEEAYRRSELPVAIRIALFIATPK